MCFDVAVFRWIQVCFKAGNPQWQLGSCPLHGIYKSWNATRTEWTYYVSGQGYVQCETNQPNCRQVFASFSPISTYMFFVTMIGQRTLKHYHQRLFSQQPSQQFSQQLLPHFDVAHSFYPDAASQIALPFSTPLKWEYGAHANMHQPSWATNTQYYHHNWPFTSMQCVFWWRHHVPGSLALVARSRAGGTIVPTGSTAEWRPWL